jgi:hypothetical protein
LIALGRHRHSFFEPLRVHHTSDTPKAAMISCLTIRSATCHLFHRSIRTLRAKIKNQRLFLRLRSTRKSGGDNLLQQFCQDRECPPKRLYKKPSINPKSPTSGSQQPRDVPYPALSSTFVGCCVCLCVWPGAFWPDRELRHIDSRHGSARRSDPAHFSDHPTALYLARSRYSELHMLKHHLCVPLNSR